MYSSIHSVYGPHTETGIMSVASLRVEEFREVTSTLSFESFNLLTYLLTYLFHGEEFFLRG
jgi:hypothetical protein